MIEITAAVPIIIAKAVKNDLTLFDLIEEEADLRDDMDQPELFVE